MVGSSIKCAFCTKKLSIIESSLTCRCGQSFCLKHRDMIEHNCSFDIRKFQTDLLRQNNIPIIAEKIAKI